MPGLVHLIQWQMYVYFYAVLGQMCDEQDLIIDFIRNCINNEKFKYNNTLGMQIMGF